MKIHLLNIFPTEAQFYGFHSPPRYETGAAIKFNESPELRAFTTRTRRVDFQPCKILSSNYITASIIYTGRRIVSAQKVAASNQCINRRNALHMPAIRLLTLNEVTTFAIGSVSILK